MQQALAGQAYEVQPGRRQVLVQNQGTPVAWSQGVLAEESGLLWGRGLNSSRWTFIWKKLSGIVDIFWIRNFARLFIYLDLVYRSLVDESNPASVGDRSGRHSV